MKLKYRKSMRRSKRRQETVYCVCQSIKHLSAEKCSDIKAVCDSTGYGDAVYEYITTDANSVYICNKYFISHTLLAHKTAEAFRELDRII